MCVTIQFECVWAGLLYVCLQPWLLFLVYNESMVSFVLRCYMRGENEEESLMVCFLQWRCGLSWLFE